MKRIVIVFDSNFKQDVRAYLVSKRVQYSMSVDIYTGDVRLSVPHANGVRLLSELRRTSIPYQLI